LHSDTDSSVLCAIVGEAVKINRSKGLPYLYNEKKHIGENCIAEITKEFACEMGFDNWHQITNHSNRKLGVTTVATNAEKGVLPVLMKSLRHKQLNTQLNYQLANEDMLKSYQSAMVGKHVLKPTEDMENVKKARISLEAIEDVSVKEHCSVNHVMDTYEEMDEKSKTYVTDSSGSTLGSKKELLVSVPTTRDLDTITTSDSER
jgi:hypothetical protein